MTFVVLVEMGLKLEDLSAVSSTKGVSVTDDGPDLELKISTNPKSDSGIVCCSGGVTTILTSLGDKLVPSIEICGT